MMGLNFSGTIAQTLKQDFLPDIIYEMVAGVDVFAHYDNFSIGIVSLADLIYMLSFIGVFVFLTVRSVEKRRWS